MTQDNELIENEQKEADTLSSTNRTNSGEVEAILKVSLKTFYYCVVVFSFLIVLFYSVFPYRALIMYSDFSMNEQAYAAASKYIRINENNYKDKDPQYDSKFADAVLACVNNSITLMNAYKSKEGVNGRKTQYYASEVIKSVNRYFSYASLSARGDIIDDYNKLNLPASMRVYFYDFETDIKRARAKALAYTDDIATVFYEVINETNNMTALNHVPDDSTIDDMIKTFYIIADVIEGQLDAVGYFDVETTASGLPLFVKLAEAELPLNGDSFSFLYNKSLYIPHEEIGLSNKYQGATPIFTRISTHIEAYKQFVANIAVTSRDQMLRKLYYTKAITDMTMNFYRFMNLSYMAYLSVFREGTSSNPDFVYIMNNETYAFWSTQMMFDIEGGGKKNPLEYFSYMLKIYVDMVNS